MVHFIKASGEQPEKNLRIGVRRTNFRALKDWRDWGEVTKVKNSDIWPILLEKIKKLLYWDKGS